MLFPWVESEEQKRQERRNDLGKRAEDIALKNFLELLVYIRPIIVQDAAILSVKYPDCSFFKHPPFNSSTFREWAHGMTSIVDAIEDESRLKLQVFPDHVIESLHGVLGESSMGQKLAFKAMLDRHDQLQDNLDNIKGLLEGIVPTLSRRRPRQTLSPALSIPSPPSSCTPSALSDPHSMVLDSRNPANALSHAAQPSTAHNVAVSQRGTVYLPTVFPLSIDPHERATQLEEIDKLELKFPSERLKHHQFEWKVAINEWLPYYDWWKPSASTYPSIEQIWTEYELGMDGQLSIRELIAGWDARWKRNKQNIKSEYSRRMKIVNLVQDLQAKPNWNAKTALQFLKARYPVPASTAPYLKSMRAFIEHLQKTGGSLRDEIFNSATSYSNT